ncbi:MAG: hypothetical protein JWM99_3614, partial [Verrucomicrobiales bacterium]|nr:hypothetical protein [Verrucomicrobiales bacterium]
YLVVWQNGPIFGGIVEAATLNMSATFQISTTNAFGAPAIVWNGTNYAVAWQESTGVYVRRVSKAGEIVDGVPKKIEQGGNSSGSFNLGLAWSGSQYLLASFKGAKRMDAEFGMFPGGIIAGNSPAAVWDGSYFWLAYATNDMVKVVRIGEAGEVLYSFGKVVVQLGSNAVIDPNSVHLATANGRVALTYAPSGPIQSRTAVRLRFLDLPLEEPSNGFVVSSERSDRHPAVSTLGEGQLIAWSGPNAAGTDYDLFGARLDRSGALLDPNGFIISAAAGNQRYPAIATLRGQAFVVWQCSTSPGNGDIFGARVDANGAVLDSSGIPLAATSDLERSPTITASDSQYFVAWDRSVSSGYWGIEGRRVSYDGTANSGLVTITPGAAVWSGLFPQVASDGSDFLVVWSFTASLRPGGESGIPSYRDEDPDAKVFGARVSAAGNLLDSVALILSPADDPADHFAPVVAYSGANYMVTWLRMNDRQTRFTDVLAVPVSSSGGVGISHIIVSGEKVRDWIEISGFEGEFFTAWREINSDSLDDLVGRFLQSDGSALGSEAITINSDQFIRDPSVLFDTTGVTIASEGPRTGTYKVLWQKTAGPETSGITFDYSTGGNWKSRFQGAGETIAGDSSRLPGFATVQILNSQSWTWNDSTVDQAALERANGTGRLAACWYAPDYLEVQINFSDSANHSVAFYCLDWDTSERSQHVEVFDGSTGALAQSYQLQNFHRGIYLIYTLRGSARVRFTRSAGYNAVLSGIFFDPASDNDPTAAQPEITPNGGSFNNAVEVALSTQTPGGAIYYTLDGTSPTTNSMVYNSPIRLTSIATLSARTFKPDLIPSAVSSANFIIQPMSANGTASFLGFDRNTQGFWKGLYGNIGFSIAQAERSLPETANLTFAGGDEFIWAYGVADPAALQMATSNGRIASCWYAGNSFEVNLQLTDNTTHSVALYLLDWDNAARTEQIEIFDSGSGTRLDVQTASVFQNGAWARWSVSGNLRIRISNIKGPNAVLSGFFLD